MDTILETESQRGKLASSSWKAWADAVLRCDHTTSSGSSGESWVSVRQTEDRGLDRTNIQSNQLSCLTSTMNSSHNFLSSMDRLSASLSTPLGSRTAMERDFDRKFMAGINLKTRPESTFSSPGSSLAPLSTGFSATSSHYTAGSFRTSDYSQSRRALPQDSTSSPTGSSPTYNLGHTSPACGKSYRTYNSISRIWFQIFIGSKFWSLHYMSPWNYLFLTLLQ